MQNLSCEFIISKYGSRRQSADSVFDFLDKVVHYWLSQARRTAQSLRQHIGRDT